MFHLSVFPDKSLNRLVLVCFIFTCFLITMHEIDTVAEMYLKPFRTYMIEVGEGEFFFQDGKSWFSILHCTTFFIL